MGDCVKREDIINALHNIGGCGADNDPWAEGWDKAIDEAIRIVQNMPAAEASPITGELKPCPFCGSEAKSKVEIVNIIGTEIFFSVECKKCDTRKGAYTKPLCSFEDILSAMNLAIEHWNRRYRNE